MSVTARMRQVEGESGAAWKEPPDAPGRFSEDDLDEDGWLDLDASWSDIEDALGQLGVKAPWSEGDDELEAADVQRLATKLVPLSWAALLKKGVELRHPDGFQQPWEAFRLFVIDAARGCNGLTWEID